MVSIRTGDLLVITTDGIAEDHLDHIDFAASGCRDRRADPGQARQGIGRRDGAGRAAPGSLDMTDSNDFHDQYVAALRTYLDTRDEDSLAVGHELGRRALQEQISMLDIIENHFRLISRSCQRTSDVDAPTALEFLLQTLAALDVATRGFSTAPGVTRNNGPAPRVSPIATSSAPPW